MDVAGGTGGRNKGPVLTCDALLETGLCHIIESNKDGNRDLTRSRPVGCVSSMAAKNAVLSLLA